MENQKLQGDIITELKPCPFCGGEADFFEFDDFDGEFTEELICIKCTICEARTAPVNAENKAAAKKITWLWNMRS